MREARELRFQSRSTPHAGWLGPLRVQVQLLWLIQVGVAAVAGAGVQDVTDFARREGISDIHAIGAQWMDWLRHLSARLPVGLPFGLELGAREATFFFRVTVTILPLMISQVVANGRHAEPADRVMSYVGKVFVLCGMAIVLAPGNLDNAPGVFASAATTCIRFILAVRMTGSQAIGRNIQRTKVLGL